MYLFPPVLSHGLCGFFFLPQPRKRNKPTRNFSLPQFKKQTKRQGPRRKKEKRPLFFFFFRPLLHSTAEKKKKVQPSTPWLPHNSSPKTQCTVKIIPLVLQWSIKKYLLWRAKGGRDQYWQGSFQSCSRWSESWHPQGPCWWQIGSEVRWPVQSAGHDPSMSTDRTLA